MQRRTFLALAALATRVSASARGMQLHLSCGALGIKANQREAVDLAAKHGFDAVDADGSSLMRLSEGEMQDLLGYMRSKKVGWFVRPSPNS